MDQKSLFHNMYEFNVTFGEEICKVVADYR